MRGKCGLFVTLILFISIFSTSFAEEKKFVLKVVGMNPNDLKALRAQNPNSNPSHFTCKDGSKQISFEQLNDDYCDCEDASDEPGTSACPNGTFYCRNTGFIGKSIPSSRVSDGVCDCCDGSDEKGSDLVSCKNTCSAEAKEANKGKQQELDATLKGLVQKQEYLERHSKELSEKKEKAKKIEEELEQLRQKRNSAEELRDKLQKEENDARDALKPKEDNKQETEAPKHEETQHNEDNQHHQEGENHDEAHYEPEGSDNNGEHYEADHGEAEEEDAEEEEEARGTNDNNNDPPPPSSEHSDLIPFIDATREQNNVVSGLNSDISNKERELEELKKIASFDFGSNNAFYALYGQCFKAETPEYTYELCPFDKVNQISKRGGGTTSLGTWNALDQTDAWKNNQSEMKFTNGVRCWGGPDRSVIVKIVCGSTNEVSDPAEPNKCEYSLLLATPAACNESHAEQLKRDLSGKQSDDDDEEEKPKTSWW
eukprot:TRINITY_DN1005_c0_g1_i1.p1 TRINITY_DN1005_c0_g1~~TRINITY_DN1005_c0_g1_i1.p1  ORF type:complete len:484 (+),score=234.01 TRINITY_DN1005_c0_g1_i1:108-1559(+)